MKENKIVFNTFYSTNPALLSIGLLLLRCLIGVYLFAAGSGKLYGWFGGYGLEASMKGFTQMGISVPLFFLSSYTEMIGGVLLVIGLFTRPAAFAIMINMTVATIVSLPGGLMGPTSAQTAIIFLIADIVILLAGPMSISIDRLIFRKS